MKNQDPIYHADLVKARAILKEYPSLARKFRLPKEGELLMLSQVFFRNLTDEEFKVFYSDLPITVGVSTQARSYIEMRRISLGLNRPKE